MINAGELLMTSMRRRGRKARERKINPKISLYCDNSNPGHVNLSTFSAPTVEIFVIKVNPVPARWNGLIVIESKLRHFYCNGHKWEIFLSMLAHKSTSSAHVNLMHVTYHVYYKIYFIWVWGAHTDDEITIFFLFYPLFDKSHSNIAATPLRVGVKIDKWRVQGGYASHFGMLWY